jgi:DNA-binding NarL/FixJ family response regulator
MVMKDMLSDLGYEVYTADEYGVLSKIKELSPNILICNLLMKETRGNLIIAKVKEVFSDIKCYVSSNDDIRIESFRGNNVDGVIKTPTKVDELKKIIGSINTDIYESTNVNTKNNSTEESSIDKGSKKNIQDLLRKLDEKKHKHMDAVIEVEDTSKDNPSSEISKVLKFCPYCGESIEKFDGKLAFCPYCGGKIK